MGDGLYIKDKAVVILCTESFYQRWGRTFSYYFRLKVWNKCTLNKRISSAGTVGWRIRVS